MAETKFFNFRQNNSGGLFVIDDALGIGPRVWIEAADADNANSQARKLGIYFDGVENGQDCECCGDRWLEQWPDDDGEPKPTINEEYNFDWHDTVYVHRLDDSIERIKRAVKS